MKFKVGSIAVSMLPGDRICEHVDRKGSFEPNTLQAWAAMVREGKTAVDVGAYTGLFSISAAMLGAHVIAVEPIPQLVKRLGQNAMLNRVAIDVRQVAASDQNGKTTIAHNPGITLSAGASLVRKSGPREPVKTVRLDDMKLSDVCAIKIDVERHEAAVLRGAVETLRKWRPSLLVEALDDALRRAVLAALPDYRLVDVLDVRNLHLEPR